MVNLKDPLARNTENQLPTKKSKSLIVCTSPSSNSWKLISKDRLLTISLGIIALWCIVSERIAGKAKQIRKQLTRAESLETDRQRPNLSSTSKK
jgi:hypothetical protein